MNLDKVTVSSESPYSDDAKSLLNELSNCLKAITGDSGNSSFNIEDVCNLRSIFVIARKQNGEAVGCGAFRPMDGETAEIKRVYAREKGLGIGTQILAYLEHQAFTMRYKALRLETRIVNKRAVSFYEHNGYSKIPNYGKYKGRQDAVCFEKKLYS